MSSTPSCAGRLGRLLSALLIAGGSLASTEAAVTISPNPHAATEGDAENIVPFGNIEPARSFRYYQQVFGARDFSFPNGPELITQIAFRPDTFSGGSFSTTLPRVEIDLSTTPRTVDGLESAFAGNIGADAVRVFAGALPLSSNFRGPPGGPKEFDIVIPLQVPFLYNPALGNLLLDVKNFSFVETTFFDAANSTDSVSRVYGPDSSAGLTDGLGLVTRFTSVLVPEPSISLLLSAAVGLVGFCRRRRHPTETALKRW
ncbi:MAG: PEP-CTERM sorting domain-containing protein [Verrucomicrobiales bacterium]